MVSRFCLFGYKGSRALLYKLLQLKVSLLHKLLSGNNNCCDLQQKLLSGHVWAQMGTVLVKV